MAFHEPLSQISAGYGFQQRHLLKTCYQKDSFRSIETPYLQPFAILQPVPPKLDTHVMLYFVHFFLEGNTAALKVACSLRASIFIGMVFSEQTSVVQKEAALAPVCPLSLRDTALCSTTQHPHNAMDRCLLILC